MMADKSPITANELAKKAGLSLECLNVPFRVDHAHILAGFCYPWEIIGYHLGLNGAKIDAIKEDNGTAEKRRIATLQAWKEKFAHRATYRVLIEALISCERAQQALDLCIKIKDQLLQPASESDNSSVIPRGPSLLMTEPMSPVGHDSSREELSKEPPSNPIQAKSTTNDCDKSMIKLRDESNRKPVAAGIHLDSPGESEQESLREDDVPAGLFQQLQRWRESAMEKPLRIMICGIGGIGKSTLINRFLQLERDAIARKFLTGRTTTEVKSYEVTKRGVKVMIFDTPGFEDPKMKKDDIIDKIKGKTGDRIHLVFYCICLAGSARLQQGDVRAFSAMQTFFSDKVWENTIVVLTRANELALLNEGNYFSIVQNITEDIKTALKEDVHVNKEVVDSIPVVPAGYTDPKLPGVENWDDRLFEKALERVDPEVLPALLETRIDWKTLLYGGLVGAISGAVGGAIGSIAGPIGASIGIATGFGVAAGAVGGVGTVAIAKVLRIVAYRFKK